MRDIWQLLVALLTFLFGLLTVILAVLTPFIIGGVIIGILAAVVIWTLRLLGAIG